MNSLETKSQTSLRYKHRSPVLNFLKKNARDLLSRSSNCKTSNLMSLDSSRKFKESNSFDVFPVVKTPPAKRYSKVVNPFEAALAERLHLPLIGSPTLFQRPPTPQHSSKQFSWTIDDVSSLQPANVEPHETQFHNSPDPDYEAKAQSAISSYFKEQQIVPSPIDCPLRSQRIVLSELTGNTPFSKPGRRIRDNVAQTILSLPPKLPQDLEAALTPYFFFNENQQHSNITENISPNCSMTAINQNGKDASLRRKLFDYQSVICMTDDTFTDAESCALTVNSPPPQSPEVVNLKPVLFDEPFYNSKLSDSIDKSSFGSLSPIAQSSTPPNLKRKSRFTFVNSSKANDPITRPFLFSDDNYRSPLALENICSPGFITPNRGVGRQSSPYGATGEISIDSIFNVKISQLVVDTAKRPKPSLDIDLFGDEPEDVDEDDMHVSQFSAISNISSESDTPRKRRSVSRKNLSQSFSFQCSSNNEGDINNFGHDHDLKEPVNIFVQTNQGPINNANCTNRSEQFPSERSKFYRTDSGFNEITSSNTQYDIKFPIEKTNFQISGEETDNKDTLNISYGVADINMLCCSTPSKHCL